MRTVRRAELRGAIGAPCAYCREPMAQPSRDHARPRSKGGTLEGQNKVIVCEPCNRDKAHRSLESWLYRLRMAGDRRAEIVAAVLRTNSRTKSQTN